MSKEPIFWFKGDDAAILAAHQRARETFRYFWREVHWEHRRIVKGLSVASVKIAFSDPDTGDDDSAPVEHMWIDDVLFDGLIVRGTLLNQPNHLSSVSKGDDVEIELNRISDWMYAVGSHQVCGAQTVNVLRSRMTAGERKRHDEMWGLDFGDPDAPALVPNWNPKPGFLGRLFGGKAVAGDPDDEHPMSRNMAPSLRTALEQNPSLLEEPDERGLSLLHQFALCGSEDGVRISLELGADKSARNVHGKTALDLARQMGWPRCVALLT